MAIMAVGLTLQRWLTVSDCWSRYRRPLEGMREPLRKPKIASLGEEGSLSDLPQPPFLMAVRQELLGVAKPVSLPTHTA